MASTSPSTTLLRFADATCPACGCLCDDLALSVEGDRVVEAANACPVGRAWFLRDRLADTRPPATIDGQPVPFAEAVAHAAELLSLARSPLLYGLTQSTMEGQGAAIALADLLGAAVVLGHEIDATPRVLANQRLGTVSATLGEIRDRADLLIYWGVDPVKTHPRHWERFVEAPGRFVPQGREARTVVVVDAEPTATSGRADAFLAVPRDRQLASLRALRALVKGLDLEPESLQKSTGLTPETLRDQAEQFRQARYGVLFVGPDLGRGSQGQAIVEAALSLVRELNEPTRFVLLNLGAPGNAPGAEAVLTWQSGYPLGVDFAPGWPSPRGSTVNQSIALADVALIVADNPAATLPPDSLNRLRALPRVVVAADPTDLDPGASVVLRTATPGLHVLGTLMRSDGLTLPLRPALSTTLPTESACLQAIASRLRIPQDRS